MTWEEQAAQLLDPLRRYLARRTDPETAADVLADTLLVLWRRRAETPEDLLPFAYGVARHCLANAHRAERRNRRLVAKISQLAPPPPPPPPMPEVQAALTDLTETERELIRLWAWEDLSVSDIAVVLDLTPNAVSLRLMRAKEKLKQALRKIDPAPGHESTERNTP